MNETCAARYSNRDYDPNAPWSPGTAKHRRCGEQATHRVEFPWDVHFRCAEHAALLADEPAATVTRLAPAATGEQTARKEP